MTSAPPKAPLTLESEVFPVNIGAGSLETLCGSDISSAIAITRTKIAAIQARGNAYFVEEIADGAVIYEITGETWAATEYALHQTAPRKFALFMRSFHEEERQSNPLTPVERGFQAGEIGNAK